MSAVGSETEVTALRKPGDLIFSLDNEIMTVKVRSGSTVRLGKWVAIVNPSTGGAIAREADADDTIGVTGYGVCIHAGSVAASTETSEDTASTRSIQIATGNAYVAMEAGGNVDPFSSVGSDGSGDVVEKTPGSAVASVVDYIEQCAGRAYGQPGGMVDPERVEDGGTVVVRLGRD